MQFCTSFDMSFQYLAKIVKKSKKLMTEDELADIPDNTDEVEIELFDIMDDPFDDQPVAPCIELSGFVSELSM